MNYFEKIEAYKNGSLSDVECLVFEEALSESPALQQELAAFELAQDLFGFVGETLSEEVIATPEAENTTDLLINFTANNLSEAQILAPVSTSTKTPIIHQLQPRRNRSAWLVAASMLFIISWIGTRFFTTQTTGELENLVAVKTQKPIETAIVEAVEPIEVSKEIVVVKAPNVLPKKQKYAPAKIRTNTKNIQSIEIPKEIVVVKESKALPEKQKYTPVKVHTNTENIQAIVNVTKQLAATTNAREITTGAKIEKNQPVVYKATESITLTPGFSVSSGTDFSAATTASNTPDNVTTNTVISEKETVVFKAGSTITLKPGFHAKAGAGFVATIEGE